MIPTATSTPIIVVWRGEYYANPDLVGASVLVRNDMEIDFNWGQSAPAAGLPADNFSARWTRTLSFVEGTYRFYARSDDGVRVWLDGELILDEWHDATGATYSADRTLSAAEHTLRIEYFERQDVAQIHVWWERLEGFPQWRGEYFPGVNMAGTPALVRNDPAINFDWGSNAPADGLPAAEFSARWTRSLRFDQGLYRFHALVDDGMRLYVDGDLVLDEWRDGAQREVTAERKLSTGSHDLRVEYYERTGLALIHVWWEQLTTYPDWRGEYWSNRTLDGDAVLVRNDPTLDFAWGQGAPDVSVPADDFSARWTRTVELDKGTYRFHIIVDDGARLWVDEQLVIDEWRDGSAREVTAEHAVIKGTHSLRVEYYEHTHDARIRVWWEKVPFPSYPDWKGEYWPNRGLSGRPALVRNDPVIDFPWDEGAPAFGLPVDDFSARWTRETEFAGATYRFHILVDDGARLWVDGALILDAWYDSPLHEVTVDYALVQGVHSLRVEYYDRTHEARIRVWWEKIVSPSYPDWKGEYWPNRYLSRHPVLVRNDEEIDFNWGRRAPAPGLPADNFSIRWSRQVTFEPGIYRFYAWADDGIRFYIDGDVVQDEWNADIGEEVLIVDLPLSGQHALMVEYFEHTGEARVKFWWKQVGAMPTPTPTMTSVPRYTPTMTATPIATSTPMPTDTPTLTPTVTPTLTDTPVRTPTPTVTPAPTDTPTPTVVPTDTPTPTPVPTDTPTPTVTPTLTPEPVQPMSTPTPTPVPPPPGVRFSEVLPNPVEVDWDGDGTVNELDEWIELYNPGPATVDLGGWYFDDVLGGNQVYRIPPRTVLRPGEFAVFYGRNTGIALDDEDGAMVRLLEPGRIAHDVVIVGPLPPDASYSRDDAGAWHDDWPPSPGAPNEPPEF